MPIKYSALTPVSAAAGTTIAISKMSSAGVVGYFKDFAATAKQASEGAASSGLAAASGAAEVEDKTAHVPFRVLLEAIANTIARHTFAAMRANIAIPPCQIVTAEDGTIMGLWSPETKYDVCGDSLGTIHTVSLELGNYGTMQAIRFALADIDGAGEIYLRRKEGSSGNKTADFANFVTLDFGFAATQLIIGKAAFLNKKEAGLVDPHFFDKAVLASDKSNALAVYFGGENPFNNLHLLTAVASGFNKKLAAATEEIQVRYFEEIFQTYKTLATLFASKGFEEAVLTDIGLDPKTASDDIEAIFTALATRASELAAAIHVTTADGKLAAVEAIRVRLVAQNANIRMASQKLTDDQIEQLVSNLAEAYNRVFPAAASASAAADKAHDGEDPLDSPACSEPTLPGGSPASLSSPVADEGSPVSVADGGFGNRLRADNVLEVKAMSGDMSASVAALIATMQRKGKELAEAEKKELAGASAKTAPTQAMGGGGV